MSAKTQVLMSVELSLCVVLLNAAINGGLSFEAGGMVVQKLAHEWVGNSLIIAAFGSCLVASTSLTSLPRSRQVHDSILFLFAIVVAILAISPFANAPESFSINGLRPTILTYPIYIWIACLVATAVLSLTRSAPNDL